MSEGHLLMLRSSYCALTLSLIFLSLSLSFIMMITSVITATECHIASQVTDAMVSRSFTISLTTLGLLDTLTYPK